MKQRLIRRFAFWNYGAWVASIVPILAIPSPEDWIVVGVHAAFTAGLLVGYCVVRKP